MPQSCHDTDRHQHNDGVTLFQGLVNYYGGTPDVPPGLEQFNNDTATPSAYAYGDQFIEPDTARATDFATGPSCDVPSAPNLSSSVPFSYELPSHQNLYTPSQAFGAQPPGLHFHVHEGFPTQSIATRNAPDNPGFGSGLENPVEFELANAILDARPSGASQGRIYKTELVNLISELSTVVPLPSLRLPRGLKKDIRHNQPQIPGSFRNTHPTAQPFYDRGLYVACCLHPYCLSHTWSTSDNKAKDNLYQKHQKVQHDEWAKAVPVSERCILLGPYSKTVLGLFFEYVQTHTFNAAFVAHI
ncbi:hypothetical protein AOL_s00169g153 [Orbilia oligospora ATCC 24927]|uniref:Uncharacterized protein n=1 Tax=Arthrobotrys oligospora (strain ATCC 24927 / CBS 115.81 / DSM 1491) TaxID=756982 RepID=G1XMV0_ARTOA|nr:hypothetical protein AOL_s00169g153 [Orbilia oligospora ATCC 24927]EGX45547.1 hypothetical protein AOL_s00169g153 [Orbilia oligospora ATCC 24927]